MQHAANIMGLILCGGLSTRMGADKGLLSIGGNAMVYKSISLLASMSLDWFISINATQRKAYAIIAEQDKFIEDNASLSVKGPLSGLLSAHLACPSTDWIVLACDMPDLSQGFIQKLMEVRMEKPTFEIYLFAQHGEPEPMCALYTYSALYKVLHWNNNGSLKKASLKYIIERCDTYKMELQAAEGIFFKNMNTPHDLHL
jgi:molybdenum cofactor guanylyltransferase